MRPPHEFHTWGREATFESLRTEGKTTIHRCNNCLAIRVELRNDYWNNGVVTTGIHIQVVEPDHSDCRNKIAQEIHES
jgi:hypothetical protein